MKASAFELLTNWILFDLDGTLIESEQIWLDVRRDFVLKFGGQWRDDSQQAMMGMRTAEWATYMQSTLHVPVSIDEIEHRVVERVSARVARNVPILPGADGALERLSSGFVLGLATSSAMPIVDAALAVTGWNKYFRVVVSADSVARGKPAPDVYLRACELLEAQACRTVAIEDSGNGIRAAHAAHVAVIAIPNREFRPGTQALGLASRIVDRLDDLSADTIHALVGDGATE